MNDADWKDAERYRFLRDRYGAELLWLVREPDNNETDLGAAIDKESHRGEG